MVDKTVEEIIEAIRETTVMTERGTGPQKVVFQKL